MELDKRSREIATFVTNCCLYRYKCFMFGVTSAHEKYQKIVADVLHGCEGVANLADDLIVHGCGIKEQGRNLHTVLTRLKEKGLTLNRDKCQFRLPKLTFFGHDLSRQGVAPSEEKVAAILNARSFSGQIICSACTVFCKVSSKLRARSRTTQEPPEEE